MIGLSATGPAGAVVLDAGRDAAEAVIANLTTEPLGGVGMVSDAAGVCSGTPVGRRLVVTAAHCIAPGNRRMRFDVPFEDAAPVRATGRAERFPGYDATRDPAEQLHVPDLAVIRLDAPLPDYVRTYAVLTSPTAPVGAAFEMAGYGLTGTGDTGGQVDGARDVKRRAFNEVDFVEEGRTAFGADFDGGRPGVANLTGSEGLGIHEGLPAFGDSGGPAFLVPGIVRDVVPGLDPSVRFDDPDAPRYLLGVSSFLDTYSAGQVYSSYGTTASWALVGPQADWIAQFGSDVRVTDGVLPVPLGSSLGFLAAALALGLAGAGRGRHSADPAPTQ